MAQINAYLTFNGNCREVMTFYRECLGGELTMQTVGESPMADQWPAQVQKHILHASLVHDGLMLLGSDMAPAEGLINGNTISLSLTSDSAEESKKFFFSLSAGGKILRPVHEFFGGTIGALQDKFGINWLLYSGKK